MSAEEKTVRQEWTYLDLGEVVLSDNFEMVVATIDIGADDAEEVGNLIAAAPDLLDAAKQLSILADQIWVKMSEEEMRLMREAWAAMDAAIAKATGGRP